MEDELKISEMEEAESVNGEDLVMIVQGGINKKTKAENIGTGANITETALLELVFPIGSTYITQTETNPNSILGFGTWERLKGKLCLGLDEDDENFNEIGKTGGEKEHVLTVAEMPSHQHKMTLAKYGTDNESAVVWESGNNTGKYKYAGDMVEPVGGSQPHNNLQPYEIVGYMWIRRS